MKSYSVLNDTLVQRKYGWEVWIYITDSVDPKLNTHRQLRFKDEPTQQEIAAVALIKISQLENGESVDDTSQQVYHRTEIEQVLAQKGFSSIEDYIANG